MTPTQFSDLTREVICGCLDNSDPLNSGGKNCIGKSEPHIGQQGNLSKSPPSVAPKPEGD